MVNARCDTCVAVLDLPARAPQAGIVVRIVKQKIIGHLCAGIFLMGTMCGQTLRADALSGLYVGASFGREQNNFDPSSVDAQYQHAAAGIGDTLKFSSSAVRRTDNAWWVNAGYLPWQYFGFDASFIHLGELTHRGIGTLSSSSGGEPVITSATLTSHGPAVAFLARIPLADGLDVDFRLGDYLSKTTLTHGLTVNSRYSSAILSSSGSSLLAGVGAVYTFAAHWQVRLDYLRINGAGNDNTLGKYDVNLAAAGVAFAF